MINELALIGFSFLNIKSVNIDKPLLYLPFAYSLSGCILAVELLLFEKIFVFKCLFGSFFMHPRISLSESRTKISHGLGKLIVC